MKLFGYYIINYKLFLEVPLLNAAVKTTLSPITQCAMPLQSRTPKYQIRIRLRIWRVGYSGLILSAMG
jgi:hypothetical protein